jgi:hypothetical protein
MIEDTRVSGSQLAAWLAARIYHDLVSPLTGLINGAALAFDDDMGGVMRGEGEKLLKESLVGMEAKIQYMRFALGTQTQSDAWADVGAAKSLFEKLFSIQKASLSWQVSTAYLTNRQMCILMNMALICLDPVARSGSVIVSAREDEADIVLSVEAMGSPGEFKPEVHAVLAGREPERGWGSAAQVLFAQTIARDAGMTLDARVLEGGAALDARGPRASM